MSTGLRAGYKQTEVGVIPEDWDVARCKELCVKIQDGTHFSPTIRGSDFLYVTSKNIRFGYFDVSTAERIDAAQHEAIYRRCDVRRGDLLLTKDGANTGNAAINNLDEQFSLLSSVAFLRFDKARHIADYFLQQVLSSFGQQRIKEAMSGNAITRLTLAKINNLSFATPTLPEQRAIAAALSDVDALLGGLERLIAKKQGLKVAAMQQLLTGQTRLPGFSGEWEVKRIEDAAECLDHVRVPLNESQRNQMRGDYPYCGANGVLDYIKDYVIDEDIILMAEDGGYFDEYETRPIAYRMAGKCWVNNHAHILRAKNGFDQGYLFYALVHKNILPFLASGTRAKLNKSEMNKIEVLSPNDQAEQTAIAFVLSDMDTELAALQARRSKTQALKQAMMQELLTGRIRLV